MKKKLIAAILTGAMLVAGMSTGVWAESEKGFTNAITKCTPSGIIIMWMIQP